MTTSNIEFPLISCIVATGNRQRFIARSIECFQSQTYPNLEFVISDHGQDDTDQIVAAAKDDRIRYERLLDPDITTGGVKNHALSRARGEFVAVWDDDDWHHPSRLMLQYQKILHSKADAAMLNRVILAWPAKEAYVQSQYFRVQGSLLSKRSKVMPFGPGNRSEDTIQCNAILTGGRRVASVNAPELYIYHIHGNNTSLEIGHNAMVKEATGKLTARAHDLVKRRIGVA